MEQKMPKPTTGVLITNLGTPSAPTEKAVRAYLAEFLSDPDVVKLPRWLWYPILYGFILRKRPKTSLELYKSIWMPEGSPLLVYSQRLTEQLQQHLGQDYYCQLGMRYGQPSLRQALQFFQKNHIQTLTILPLYPQYSKATTGSTVKAIGTLLKELCYSPKITLIESYYDNDFYINQLSTYIQQKRQNNFIIFSFHGLPQVATKQGDPYESQCRETAKLLATAMNLKDNQWAIAFQSRFGAQKWLQPYCDELLKTLPSQGIKCVDIVCPGFAVDCLETLEEIAQRYKEVFLHAGGTNYHYIPAMNDKSEHVSIMKDAINRVSTIA
jgi:ferrochelatase